MQTTARQQTTPRFDLSNYARSFTPKLMIALRTGYSSAGFVKDTVAGFTVAVLALPLSMAIAIGCGLTPDKGLITSVVAGFLISALGGSRFQVGGPAAAFIVIIADIVTRFGYPALLTTTFLAGLLLIVAGFLKLGTYVKYVPGPVILGFTCGVGALIGIGQIKDFIGLQGQVPADIIVKLQALWNARTTFNPSAFFIGAGALTTIFVLKHYRPKWPGLLIAVVAASAIVAILKLPVETIGSRYGGIAGGLPTPILPDLSWSMIERVFPSALTIGFLIGVESLLSAVAADAMTGGRHRSNVEIVGQGIANVAAPLFGGIPATGVLARTATNISAGAITPISGMMHAIFVLIAMLVLGPLASYLAMPCLAAVLLSVAWRLLDLREIASFLRRAPTDDRIILVLTIMLTVFVSLDVAIAVGVVMGAMMFMHRMAEAQAPTCNKHSDTSVWEADGIRVYRFQGPLFFGAATGISSALDNVQNWPRVIVLALDDVPLIDATAISALEELAVAACRHKCRLVMTGLQPQPRRALHAYGFPREHRITLARDWATGVERARKF